MADTGDVYEEKLEIKIGHEEFVSGLNKIVNGYNSTLKNINTINVSVAKSFDGFAKQTNSALSLMSTNVSKKVEESVRVTSQVVQNATKEIKQFQQNADKSLSEIDKRIVEMGKSKKEYLRRMSTIDDYTISDSWKKDLKGEATEKHVGNVKRLRSEIIALEQEHYKQTNNISKTTMHSIVAVSEASAKAIASTVNALSQNLNKVRQFTGKTEEDIAKILQSKDAFKAIEDQQKQINEQVERLGRDRLLAYQNVEQSKIALTKQTEGVLRQEALKTYQENLQYLERINVAYKKAKENQLTLANQMKITREKVDTQTSKTRGGLQEGFIGGKEGATQSLDVMKSLLDKMTKQLSELGTKGTSGISQLINGFKTMEGIIVSDENKLREMISHLEKLSVSDVKSKEMLPGLKGTLANIENLRMELSSSVDLINKLSLTGPLVKAEEKFKSLQIKSVLSLNEIKRHLESFNQLKLDDVFSIEKGIDNWKSVRNEVITYGNFVKSVQSEIFKSEQEYKKYTVEAARSAGTEKEAVYRAYATSVLQHIEKLKAAEISVRKTEHDGIQQSMRMQKELVNASKSYSEGIANQQSTLWSGVKQKQDEFLSKYKEIEKATINMTKGGKIQAEALEAQFDKMGKELIDYRIKIKQAIADLKTLTSKGAGDFTSQINSLKALEREYDLFARTVGSKMGGVAKMMRAQSQAVQQSWFKTGWEMIRNFRWQVATIIYLATRAVQGIKNVFIGTLEEVSSFRKGVYAITAGVGLGLGKDFKNHFEEIYNYSRGLSEKLQTVAAQSYASLEDMMMVTRSLTQSGIFPKSNEDVERINTLATAVKVMTEGMANAGTQMRQEIMALIEGRQRVTDSVALAFKMRNIDIKKEMAKWKKEGTSILVGLSDLLEPHAEINKRIGKEYETQVNNLKEMWGYIKRIASEELSLQVATDIKEFIATLGSTGESLTELGQSAAKMVKGTLVTIYELSKSIGVIVFDLFKMFGNIFESIGLISMESSNATEKMSAWGSALNNILKTMQFITTTIRWAIWGVSSIVNLFSSAFYLVRGIAKVMSLDIAGASEDFASAGKKFVQPFMEANDIINDFDKGMANATRAAVDLDNSVKNIKDTFSQTNMELLNHMELQKRTAEFLSQAEKEISANRSKETKASDKIKEVQSAQKALIEDLKKAQKEAEEELLRLTKDNANNTIKIHGETAKGIIQIQGIAQESLIGTSGEIVKSHGEINTSIANVEKQSAEALVGISNNLKSTIMSDIQDTLAWWVNAGDQFKNIKSEIVSGVTLPKPEAAEAEREGRILSLQKKIKDSSDMINSVNVKAKEEIDSIQDKLDRTAGSQKTVIDYTKEYYDLLERFGKLDPFTKIWLEYESNVADINKAAQENYVVQQHLQELLDAANKKYWYDYTKYSEEANDKYMDMKRKASMTELGELGKIEEQYRDYARTVMDDYYQGLLGASKELNESRKEELLLLISSNVELAKQKKLADLNLEIKNSYLDLYDTQAKYLSESLSFSDQRQAQLIQEQIAYERYKISVVATLKEINEKWGSDAPQEVQEYTNVLKQNLDLQADMLEKHKDEIMNPFWQDMKKMSQEWIDDVSDKAADVIMKTTTMAEAATDLINSMFKQVLTSFIKYNLMQPISDQMQNFGKGTQQQQTGIMSGIQGLLGQSQQQNKSLLDNVSATNPLPVLVTNLQASMIGGGLVGNDTAAATKEVIEGTKQSINSNVTSGFSNIFNNVKSGFSGLFGMLGNGLNSVLSMLSNAGSGLGSMFGGGGSGGGGFALSDLFGGWSGTTGMKDGGTIQEPIFGVGLRTSKTYSFGEVENEIVTPMSEYRRQAQGAANEVKGETHIHMPISLQAIDTQSGVQFLQKHAGVLEAQMIKGLRGNKKIRKSVKQSF